MRVLVQSGSLQYTTFYRELVDFCDTQNYVSYTICLYLPYLGEGAKCALEHNFKYAYAAYYKYFNYRQHVKTKIKKICFQFLFHMFQKVMANKKK